MESRSEPAPAPLKQSPLLNLLVLSPLLLSLAAAILLLGIAPSTWGVADDVGLAPWVPTTVTLIVAAPVLVSDIYALLLMRGRMSGRYEVDMAGALAGGAAHWAAAVCLVIFAGTMGSEDSYRSLGAGGTSSGGFIFLAVIAAMIGGVLLGGLTAVYVWAITPGRRTRLAERTEDEPDFLQDWVRGRRR